MEPRGGLSVVIMPQFEDDHSKLSVTCQTQICGECSISGRQISLLLR